MDLGLYPIGSRQRPIPAGGSPQKVVKSKGILPRKIQVKDLE